MFGRMKDPVEATAILLAYELTNANNELEVTVHAHVVVAGPGLPPTTVDFFPRIPRKALPMAPGTALSVRVDRRKPKRIRLLSSGSAAGQSRAARTSTRAL
jgi:hypothetical protein